MLLTLIIVALTCLIGFLILRHAIHSNEKKYSALCTTLDMKSDAFASCIENSLNATPTRKGLR